MIEEDSKEVGDYIDALRARRKPILVIVAVLFSISLLVALLLPPVYLSKATILIEEQEIPPDLIRSTITSYAWQRIQTISQRVMTRSNLLELVDKYDLYHDKRRRETSEEIIDRMRNDIGLEPLNADVVDPRTGTARRATIAFTLSYESVSPVVAQKLANELTTLFLSENLKSREEKATDTYDFLSDESKKLGEHIAELETKLAAFKEKNINQLPELAQLNMSLMERTERELMDTQNEIRSLEERKFYLDGQLAQINPNSPMFSADGERIMDSATRLKVMKTEYAAALGKYSPDHPDVVRMRREIDTMEKKTGGSVPTRETTQSQAKEILRLRTELTDAQKKYSPDHPDVIRLSKEVQSLEETIKQAPPADSAESIAAEKPENPAYINLKSQLEVVSSGLKSVLRKKDELKTKLSDYEKRIVQTPQVEREYLDLKRDYENSQRRYQELKGKQMEAQAGQQMEKERKGERFSLIEPPQLPEKPVKPNRYAIVFLGLILSLTVSVGYGFIAESLDTSIRTARRAAAVMGVTTLTVIPYIENITDKQRREKTRKLAMKSAIAGLIVAVLLIQFLWVPWDVLWFKSLRILTNVVGG